MRVTDSERISVLVAENQPMLREGLGRLLESQPGFEVHGLAADATATVTLARQRPPDVVLLEIDLEPTSGLRTLELLHDAAPHIRILLFGAAFPSATAVEALALGARGVLPHAASTALLFRSLRAVANGEYWVPRALINELARQVHSSSARLGLTTREQQVVSLVVAGYSNKEIASRCELSVDTVKHHLTNAFAKTGASTRVELAVFALHHGIAGREGDETLGTSLNSTGSSRVTKMIPRPRPSSIT